MSDLDHVHEDALIDNVVWLLQRRARKIIDNERAMADLQARIVAARAETPSTLDNEEYLESTLHQVGIEVRSRLPLL